MKENTLLLYKVIVVIGVLLIYGCAAPMQKDLVQDVTEDVAAKQDAAEAPETAAKSIKETAIDADVLFMLLTAEIAVQRQRYDIALDGYLQAAQRVQAPQLAKRAAKIAFYLKDNKKTSEAVALWLKQDPDSFPARKTAVLAALRSADIEAAVKHLDFLLRADPAGFEFMLLEIVKIMHQEQKSTLLYKVLDELAIKHPDEAVVYFVQAVLALQQKDHVLAQQKIDTVLDLEPDWSKALIIKAQIAVMSSDNDTAIKILEDAVEELPGDARLKKMLAQVLIRSSKYEKAQRVYQQVIVEHPDDSESKYALALVYLQLQQDEQAKLLFEELVAQRRWHDQSSLYLGRIEVRRKNVDKAMIWFDKITSGPLVFEAGVNALSTVINSERFEIAEQRLANLQGKFPNQKLRLLLLEAELYNKQKQYQKAFDLLTSALLEKPEQKELLYTRALIAERLDLLDVLEADLKYILEKHPNDANALNALGYTLADRTDRYAEAKQYLELALELQPNEAVILDSFGWLQFKLGNLDDALEYLQRAYDKQKEGEIAAHLIEVLWALGEQDEASRLFEKAQQEMPEDEYIQRVQERIQDLN